LLVLGMSIFAWGYYHKVQKFSSGASQTNSSMLLIVLISILIPGVLTLSLNNPDIEETVLNYSRLVSVVMLIVYGCFLFFQLKSVRKINL